MRTKVWTRATRSVMVLLALVLLIPATSASADPPGQSGVVERLPVLNTPLFWDGDVIVLIDPPIDEASCTGLAAEGFEWEGFPRPMSTVVSPPGGAEVIIAKYLTGVQVYDVNVSNPGAWVFGTCAAILAGAPAPEPAAHGEGHFIHAGDNYRVTARVTTTDGREVPLTVVASEEGERDLINYGG